MTNLTQSDSFSKEEQMSELNRLQNRMKEIDKEKKVYENLIDEEHEVYARIREIESQLLGY